MEFRILGPLEARRAGVPLSPGGPKQRALLALLLLHANEPVSRAALIDGLWGERPPATAAKALQVYVSQLRRELGRGLVRTHPGGYQLVVEPDAVDLSRFERLVAEARAAAPGAAAAKLREALALWRGAALADVADEPFAQAEVGRLEELRLGAGEALAEAELALGRHAELVPTLEGLVAHNPLRERLRGQLMLALYRSGRQADALEAYQAARSSLVEELGLEPSRALQDLEQAILRHDPALELDREAVAPDLKPDEDLPASALPEPVPERKLATVLFVDLVGSTELGEQDPERTRAFLERYYDGVAAEIEAAGGTLEKFAGDAVLAAFGAPAGQEDHAERALHAALAVRSRCDALFGGSIAVHVGVNTGEVVVGRAREGSSFVTGDAVNVAARLEQVAEPGESIRS